MLDTLVTETSHGELVFELTSRLAGFRSAFIAMVDERGVAAPAVHWIESDDAQSFSGAIADAAGLPQAEAEALAERVLSEWETRPEQFGRRQRTAVLFAPVFMLVILPLSVLWILVWLVLQLT